MDLYVLDKNFNTVDIVDYYESFIWTDRYNECGDFEIRMLIESSEDAKNKLSIFKMDYYVYFSMSSHLMIIEDHAINTDSENGDRLTITGRSLESLLDRRVVWQKTTIPTNGSFHNYVLALIRNAIGSTAAEARRIGDDGFLVIENAAEGSELLDIKLDLGGQYLGDNLYDVVTEICKTKDVGFKIRWVVWSGDGSNHFGVSLYLGTDRTYDTTKNPNRPPVIFSPFFENISNTEYYKSKRTYRTVALVTGQEKDNGDVPRAQVKRGNKTGFDRREMYVDASSISHKKEPEQEGGQETTISDSDYTKLIQAKAREEMSMDNNSIAETFEGEVEYRTSFVYGEDYVLGDIVEVADIYGHETPARISEVTFSYDEEGFSLTPTFTVPDEEEITAG